MTTASEQALVETIAQLQRRVDALERTQRTPQLPTSALGPGQSIDFVDETGALAGRIGWQADDTVGLITAPGEVPPMPSAPILTPGLGGLRVVWDGRLVDAEDLDVVRPSDLAHVEVHVSTTPGFATSATTRRGTITQAGTGGMLPVLPLAYVTQYVRLVAVTTGAATGPAGAEASATPLRVDGPDLTAGSVTAGIIAAGAVEADKLAAILVLASRVLAGDPNAARVEMNSEGFRAYNDLGELTVAIDAATGSAAFTGTITGSEISGSRMTIGAAPGNTGAIEDSSGVVRNRVTSSTGQRAQIAAQAGGAEFTVWADPFTPAPVGGMLAQAGIVALTMQSVLGDFTQPYSQQQVESGRAAGTWRSSSGSGVIIQALPDYASILLTAPEATDPNDAQGSGFIFTQRTASDIAAVSLQGPQWATDTGPEFARRAVIFAEGARPERAYTRIAMGARKYLLTGETVSGVYDTTSDGVVELSPTHSFSASAHQPHVEELITPPVWTSPTTGSFVDFAPGEWAPISWRTGWSGWVEITIVTGGLNPNTSGSSLSVGFRLSGGSTVSASLTRCAFIRSIGQAVGLSRSASITVPLQLAGVADYTLTPAWRLSSFTSGGGRDAFFDTSLANRITVRNLP